MFKLGIQMPPFPDCMKGYYAGGFACIQNNDWYDMYIYPSYFMSNKCILEYTCTALSICIHSYYSTLITRTWYRVIPIKSFIDNTITMKVL